MKTTILEGLTRQRSGGRDFSNPNNPMQHTPFGMQNRVILEKLSPDGKGGAKIVQRVVRQGNIMCSVGIDALVNLLATSALNFTATNGWVQAGAVGTGDTGPASTDTALANSTASVHISAASMNLSDLGARTLEFQMTFDDANGYTIKEVGLFASNGVTGSCVARSTLDATDQVIKGTADTVNVSHQVILTTV